MTYSILRNENLKITYRFKASIPKSLLSLINIRDDQDYELKLAILSKSLYAKLLV